MASRKRLFLPSVPSRKPSTNSFLWVGAAAGIGILAWAAVSKASPTPQPLPPTPRPPTPPPTPGPPTPRPPITSTTVSPPVSPPVPRPSSAQQPSIAPTSPGWQPSPVMEWYAPGLDEEMRRERDAALRADQGNVYQQTYQQGGSQPWQPSPIIEEYAPGLSEEMRRERDAALAES